MSWTSFSVVRALAFAAAELEAAAPALPRLMTPFHLGAAAEAQLDEHGDHVLTLRRTEDAPRRSRRHGKLSRRTRERRQPPVRCRASHSSGGRQSRAQIGGSY